MANEKLKACSEDEKIAILESLGWDYLESSDGTGAMFMFWDDPTKDMPDWCPDSTTSCECLENVWKWYLESEGK